VSEVIGKGFSSAFQSLEYTLDSIQIPVGEVLKSERMAMAAACSQGAPSTRKTRR